MLNFLKNILNPTGHQALTEALNGGAYLVDVRTPAALVARLRGERPDDGDPRARGQRQDAVVLQQDDRLGRRAPGHGMVSFDVELSSRLMREHGELQHAADGRVDERLIESALTHRRDDLSVGAAVAARHLKIHAGPHTVDTVADGPPIRDHGTAEPPVAAEDVGQ